MRRRALWALAPAWPLRAQAPALTVAAASDLRFALQALVAERPEITLVFGATGKLATQIRQGAPFDVFLAADRSFTDALHEQALCTPSQVFAHGHLVCWSRDETLGRLPLQALAAHARLRRFAIANPRHAPYGQRAEQVLRRRGVWAALADRLVLGDNVAQATQFVQSGAAQAGLVALSLLRAPQLQGLGAYTEIAPSWHDPLQQAVVITRRGQAQRAAVALVQQVLDAQALWRQFGFSSPGS